jgi:putative acetyltransferase
VLIRRETAADVEPIRAVHTAAFAPMAAQGRPPVEAGLVDALRACEAWLPELSFVAAGPDGQVIGHVVCTRAHVDGVPALGLGPLGVHPSVQRRGAGHALMHAVLAAADALGEPIVVLLGHAGYYPRFGFRPAADYGITPPVAEWAPHFQARPLTAYQPTIRGAFVYARPFYEL